MWLDDLQRDVTYAIKSLRRSPGFCLAAVLTLALGIGANAAIFSVLYGVLWKPLPFNEPDRLVRIDEITPAAASRDGRERRSGAITVEELRELRSRAKTVSRISFSGGPALMTFSGHGEAARLQGQRVAPGIFDTLGVPPLMGRSFGAEEEHPGADRSIVLSYPAWQRHFVGDAGILGRTFTLADALRPNPHPQLFSVVGVMPEGFAFPDRQIEFWIPVSWNSSARGSLIARLADTATHAAAEAEIGSILRELRTAPSDVAYRMTSVSQQRDIEDVKSALFVLAGAAAFVLLIACANVANLLLARSAARQREAALQLALGAGRGRLVRQLLTESTLLALFGGALGTLVAVGGIRALKSLATTLGRMDLGVQLAFPRLEDISIDPLVLAFVVIVSTSAGVLLGLATAIPQTRLGRMSALRETGTAYAGFGAPGRSTGSIVVAAEISLALILLVGCGLLMRSFINLLRIDPGYNAANVLTFQVALPSDRYPLARVRSFADDLTSRLQSIPGVRTAYGQPPLIAITESALFRRTPDVPKSPRNDVARRLVSSDYLNVMGIRIVAGRGFTESDRAGQSRVLLINETLARREFPEQNPIGRQVYAGSDAQPWEIVGIVADVRQSSLDREAGPQVFALHSQWPGEVAFVLGPYFSVRTRTDPSAIIPNVREFTRELEPEAGLFNIATMDQLVSNRMSRPRMYTVLLGIFAGMAVVLAAIGVYGVIAYSVSRRTREIGIRMALGAQRSEVIALILRQSAIWNGIGFAAGLAGATTLTRYLESMLFGVTPLDPTTVVAVSALLLAVATLAAFVPAQRATRIHPLAALRHD